MGMERTRPNVSAILFSHHTACHASSRWDPTELDAMRVGIVDIILQILTLTTRSLVIYSKIVATPSTVYLLGLAKSFSSYTLHVTSLSPVTGELVASSAIPSSVTTGFSDVVVLRDLRVPELDAHLVWLEDKILKSFQLTPGLKDKPAVNKGVSYKSVHDVGVSEYGQLVAVKDDGSGRVIRLSSEGLKVIWEYTDSVRTAQHWVLEYHPDRLLAGQFPPTVRFDLRWRSRCRWLSVHRQGLLVAHV